MVRLALQKPPQGQGEGEGSGVRHGEAGVRELALSICAEGDSTMEEGQVLTSGTFVQTEECVHSGLGRKPWLGTQIGWRWAACPIPAPTHITALSIRQSWGLGSGLQDRRSYLPL